jgi:hypothetical protein
VHAVTFELGRSLLLADAVAPDALAHALLVVATSGVSLARALVAVGAIEVERLEAHLARGDAPVLRHVAPVVELVARLPYGLCERLLAVPVRQDALARTVDVAVVDARDTHARDEIAYWLEAPVRLVRTSFASMESALARMRPPADTGVRALAAPIWVPAAKEVRAVAETPLYGTRAVDARPEEDPDTGERTEIGAFPAVDPNIPIPLQARKSFREVSIVEIDGASVALSLDQPTEPAVEPVHDLRLRKRGAPSEPPRDARPAATTRGPYAPSSPSLPFADVGAIVASMRAATDRDRVLDLLLAGARTVARRVAILAVKKHELVGWTCTPELGDRAALRRVHVPIDPASHLSRALSGGTHLGRLAKMDAHAALFDVMGGAPTREVAVTGVLVEGRATIVVIADEVGDTLIATRRLDELARVAGESLASIIRQRPR